MSTQPPPTLFPDAALSFKDPQVAAGHKYALAIDTGTLWLHDRSTGSWTGRSANDFFAAMMTKVNQHMHLPKNICDPGDSSHNSKFKPADPNTVIPGNIDTAYDARVFYDKASGNFWVACALRHPLWPCKSLGIFPGVQTGSATDPSFIEPSGAVCHMDWNVTPRRFIAVAVSKGESSLDLSDLTRWHQYVLVDEYEDWPQMAVNGGLLVLNHRGAAGTTFVFDAEALAAGRDAGSVMKATPLAGFTSDDFLNALSPGVRGITEWACGKDGFPVLPVNVHGESDGLTFLIGGCVNMLFIFAVENGGGSGKPRLLDAAVVPMLNAYHHPSVNAVYQSGHLLVAFSVPDWNLIATPSPRFSTVVLRLRVRRVPGQNAIAADDFWQHVFGGADDNPLSYMNPCVEVTSSGDIVVAYNRVGLAFENRPASARYSVMPAGESVFLPSMSLHDGGQSSPGVLVVSDPVSGHNGIDLPGIAQDPSVKHGVWVAHAFGTGAPDADSASVSSGLTAVVARIATA